MTVPIGITDEEWDALAELDGSEGAGYHIGEAIKQYIAKKKKPKKPSKRFIKPEKRELATYFHEKGSLICNDDAEAFIDHYDSNGWKIGGKGGMKCWKAAVRNWMRRNKEAGQQGTTGMLGTDISDLYAPEVKADTSDALEFMVKNRLIKD